jgi:hypothetical protein
LCEGHSGWRGRPSSEDLPLITTQVVSTDSRSSHDFEVAMERLQLPGSFLSYLLKWHTMNSRRRWFDHIIVTEDLSERSLSPTFVVKFKVEDLLPDRVQRHLFSEWHAWH